ncbi:putative metal-dependent hydrolase [bacterium SCSIO 12741]|nr:putative metal-dependent hydrolase [bacterium SCSIO 12741]
MDAKELEALRYPVGKFEKPTTISPDQRKAWMEEIALFPANLRTLVQGISEEQKQLRYRPEGWTLAQVVHHCADSHLNSLIRFKWALTENNPTIKAYFEDRWAELPDSQNLDLEPSLQLLEGLHKRWAYLLTHLTSEQLQKTFVHPETMDAISLDQNVANYAWHGRHHLAHVKNALELKF